MKRLVAMLLVLLVMNICVNQTECLAAKKGKATAGKGQAEEKKTEEKKTEEDGVDLKACPLTFTGTFLKVVGKDNYYVNPDKDSNLNGRTLLTLTLRRKDINACPVHPESDPEEWINKKITIKGVFDFTPKSKNTQLKFVGDIVLESITLVGAETKKK